MPRYRKNTKIRSILIFALAAGVAQHIEKNWVIYADYKLPNLQLRYENFDSRSIDLLADIQEIGDPLLDGVDLLHYVAQLQWGSSESSMLMVVLDVFAKNEDARDAQVEKYIRKHLKGFNGSRVFMRGGFTVRIPANDWVEFRQVVIQPDEAEDLSKYASKITRYSI